MNQDETFAEIPDDEMRQYEDEFNDFLAEVLEYSEEMHKPFFSQEDGMNNDGSDDDPYVKTKPQVVLDWFNTEKEF